MAEVHTYNSALSLKTENYMNFVRLSWTDPPGPDQPVTRCLALRGICTFTHLFYWSFLLDKFHLNSNFGKYCLFNNWGLDAPLHASMGRRDFPGSQNPYIFTRGLLDFRFGLACPASRKIQLGTSPGRADQGILWNMHQIGHFLAAVWWVYMPIILLSCL